MPCSPPPLTFLRWLVMGVTIGTIATFAPLAASVASVSRITGRGGGGSKEFDSVRMSSQPT